MNEQLNPLFTPWKIGNVEIKNRIVLCPMGGTSLFGWMRPNSFDETSANFFLERAKHDVGLIIPGIAPLKDPILGRWLYKNKKMFKKLKPFMDDIHKEGSKLFVQLTAGFGRSFAITKPLVLLLKCKPLGWLCKPFINASYLTASPSELPSRWDESVKCRQMTVKEIKKIIEAYAKTAKLCKDAGVDGVEVHAVHEGYLLDQFTTKYTNFRKDEYGGSFENRYRFAVEVVKAIKALCGEDYPVSLRYSVTSKTKGFCSGALPGESFHEVGRDMEESEKAAKYLEDAGYDMLNADNGTYDAWYWAHPPAYMPNNCNLEDVAHIKKFVNIPVVAAGKMEPLVAAKAIADGDIDAMGVARQFLTDHAWVSKLKDGHPEDIKPCILCHNACFDMAHYKGVANDETLKEVKSMARCALNPMTMNRKPYNLKRTKHPKKVAVIGGGIGGMEAALVLKLKGHTPIIYEKSNHLGGVWVEASNPSFKERDKELLEWYIREIRKNGIEVHLNHEVKAIDDLGADEVIIATGAKANKLRVPGNEFAIDAIEYLDGKKVGKEVVVIGGGLTGCEIAYDLHLKGKKPIIIEMKNDLMAQKGLCLANSSYLRDYFKWQNVPVHLEAKVLAIAKDYVEILNVDGKKMKIPCDDVISCIGYHPAPVIKKSRHVHIIGDAKEVGNLRTVIWGAWDVCSRI